MADKSVLFFILLIFVPLILSPIEVHAIKHDIMSKTSDNNNSSSNSKNSNPTSDTSSNSNHNNNNNNDKHQTKIKDSCNCPVIHGKTDSNPPLTLPTKFPKSDKNTNTNININIVVHHTKHYKVDYIKGWNLSCSDDMQRTLLNQTAPHSQAFLDGYNDSRQSDGPCPI